MQTKNKKTPKVNLSPIGEYCEGMRSALWQQGKELSADIATSLSFLEAADFSFRDEYGYLEFCVRTGIRQGKQFEKLSASMKNKIEQLFAAIYSYQKALDKDLPRGV